MGALTIHPLPGVPLVAPGDDLAAMVLDAIAASGLSCTDGDVIVLAQKIVSKAEGRLVRLDTVIPSPRARDLAQQCRKDPRLVELILSESTEVMRVRPGVLIVRHRLGLVLANAGIDQSNIDHGQGEAALLLPQNPDASAAALQTRIAALTGAAPAIVIIDSLGRAWRMGTCGIAIGVAGLPALLDLRGRADIHGRALQTSELGLADEVAAAASLVMGQAGEAIPAVLVRGLAARGTPGCAADLVRPPALDLFP